LTAFRIAGPCFEKTALGIWFIGGAYTSVEVGQKAAMSRNVRLPMMCRLAFHTVATVQAAASGSPSNIHFSPPSGSATKPSIEIDIFKISSRIASSLRWSDPGTGPDEDWHTA